jgi:hypothetical protein
MPLQGDVLPDYESDEEEEEVVRGEAAAGRLHRPRQSWLYSQHAELIRRARDATGYTAMALFLLLVLLTSWINLEEGRFPFNVDVIADMAYSRRKWGTPATALGLVALAGVFAVVLRSLLLTNMEAGVYHAVEGNLRSAGRLRKVDPRPPKAPGDGTQSASASHP